MDFLALAYNSAPLWVKLLCWAFYLLGQTAYMLHRADMTVRSGFNSITSIKQYFAYYRTFLAIRYLVVLLIFLYWQVNPSGFLGLSKWLGYTIPSGLIPLTPITAGGFGLASDVLLDAAITRVKWLQKIVPPLPILPLTDAR